MFTAIVLLSLVAVVFWRSLFRFLLAMLLALIVLGGIHVARVIGTIVPQNQPPDCSVTGQARDLLGCLPVDPQ